MVCCLNPDCPHPQNPDGRNFCQSCGTGLVPLLRVRYHVIQPLGGGGFGRTYLAEDVDKLSERCVVKQFAPQVQGSWAIQKATELFKQEAQRLQQLGNHPQIPTLYAYFEEDKRLYLVQEFVEGQNLLQELAQQGAFTEQKIRELLNDLLPVLQFVHSQQVIHRDIKPENIIRRRSDGKLVLIDFGVAKQATATAMAKPGTTIGSLGYAPIEQMKGGEAYPASDLFSLGATCFHLLTQADPRLLFLNHGYDWVHNWRQHLRHPVGTLTGSVLDKLLQKHQHQRYQSAAEVLNDLNKPAPPPPVPPTVPSHSQSSPPPSTIIAQQQNPWMGAIVILLLGLGGYWYWWLRPPSPPTTSPTAISNENISLVNTLTMDSKSVSDVAISRDGQTLVSGSYDNTIQIWNLSTGTLIRTLTGHSNSVISVAISPDGQTLVSGSLDNTIKIWNLSTGTLIRTLTGHSNSVISVAISPDGQTLVSGSYDNIIKIWNLSTGTLIRTLTGDSSSVYEVDLASCCVGAFSQTAANVNAVNSVAISPDGHTLVNGSDDKTIKIWNLSTGTLIRTLTGHSESVNSVAISPDGQTLVSGSRDKTIKIWNLSTDTLIRTLTGHSESVNSVAISPNGQTLVSGSGDSVSSNDNTIKIWNLSTGTLIRTLTGHSDSVDSVAISPDGQTLVSGSGDNTIKIWRVPK